MSRTPATQPKPVTEQKAFNAYIDRLKGAVVLGYAGEVLYDIVSLGDFVLAVPREVRDVGDEEIK